MKEVQTAQKRLWYSFTTVSSYSSPVSEHAFMLRCVPLESDGQRIERSDVQVIDCPCLTSYASEASGDLRYGMIASPHKRFVFISQGIVVRRDSPRIDEGLSPETYMYPTQLTRAGHQMRDAARQAAGTTPCAKALSIMHIVHSRITYKCGVTSIDTGAAEAWELGCGVCQDYAHILIAMCREVGIAARYVSGYMCGEGATHAWVEVWDGKRWLSLDPTHDREADLCYIKLSQGRDASECAVVRGVYRGAFEETNTVRIIVEEL